MEDEVLGMVVRVCQNPERPGVLCGVYFELAGV